MKRVIVTGGTGFVGSALVQALVGRGDRVTLFTRRPDAHSTPVGARVVAWTPDALGDWAELLSDTDVVVHLAGEPALGARWTDEVKRRIKDSRVISTQTLVRAIEQASPRPRALISASAVGYYGARDPNERLDESAAAGSDFLAQVCVEWERAARAAEKYSLRVVCARIGVVLGPGGGALAEMVKPFKLYAGGPIASGEQVVSWIHLDDTVAALCLCIDDPRLEGPVNLTAPEPATNAELSRAIGEVLGKPAWLRVPAAALRLRFGEAADVLITGQRAVPDRLGEVGYAFSLPDLKAALTATLAPDAGGAAPRS